MKPILMIGALFYFVLGLASQIQAQSKLYWADSQMIWRGNLDGTNVQLVRSDIDSLTAMAIDAVDRKLYWSTKTQVWRALLNGTSPELILEGNQIADISIDPLTQKLYLTPPLLSINLDSLQIDTLSTRNFKRFTFDPLKKKLYGILDSAIQTAQMDTFGGITGLRPLFNQGSFDDLQFLPKSDRIYWLDSQNDAIRRGGLLTNQTQLVLQTGLLNVRGFVVNENAQKIYWATKSRPSSTVSTIYTADIDGNNIKEVTSVSSNGGWVKDMVIYHPSSGNAAFGDVNSDGKIDSIDAILILRGIIGIEPLTPEQQSRADVNGDKSIDSRDATLVLRRIINLISKFPVENL